ncbi:tyrosine-type recombinase/integrase [Velocimicrobium porci]|uniref:Tyrosine-type recombinase/integrase n=1 Tax=Velocimicrobium porci TaxID=2606634 RepID=A0A6L5Y291_9FIRM|nr:tyrosine-type recombinase/integrase [Velocimicrobium porci]MSS64987.1 tyrosine-type recombinase/integrase [Velocimicrobium porci]
MQEEKRTIKYNDAIRNECNEKIAEYLEELPNYCAAFNSSRARQIQVRARKENLRDIKLFFRFITETNPLFKDKSLKEITPEILEQFTASDFEDFANWISEYNGKDKNGADMTYTNSDVGIKRKLSSVRALYRFLYNREYISSNPSLKADLPKLQKKDASTTKILEKFQREPFFAEVDAAYDNAFEKIENEFVEKGKNSKRTLLLPAIAMRDKTMIYLLITTGMRLSELCGIDCTDYSREMGTINIIRKGNIKDSVYISEEVQGKFSNHHQLSKDEVPHD